MKYLLFILFSLLSICSFANDKIRSYNWMLDSNKPFLFVTTDSTTTPYSILLETPFTRKGTFSCSIPLPKQEISKIEIKVNYKMENCGELYLKINSIGECEKINAVDTLHLPPNKEWSVYSQFADVVSPLLLNLSLEATGDGIKNGKIWISDLDIFIDGKNISEFKPVIPEKGLTLTKVDVFPLDLDSLPFMDKRILAIGENIHGTETLNNIAFEIIKKRVENKECKIVLLELPFEYSFYINRYIDDDSDFKRDSIISTFNNLLYSDSTVALIDWIKKYNSKSEEKVHFLGIDMNITEMQSQLDLFNFFYTLSEKRGNDTLKVMCKALLKRKDAFKTCRPLFEENKRFEGILNKKETKMMEYCLGMLERSSPSTNQRFIKRDSIMFENSKFIMNDLFPGNRVTTIFCHIGHSSYLNESSAADKSRFSFGYYMKNMYKEDYANISLTANEGTFLTFHPHKQVFADSLGQLRTSPPNSLEHLINKLDVDSCYLPMDEFTCDDVLRIREIGNRDRQEQFMSIIPKVRIDGVIFFKQASAIQRSKKALRRNIDRNALMMFDYMRAIEIMKK